MDRWGAYGPLFHHFLQGSRDDLPAPMDYDDKVPNARKMNELAVSTTVHIGLFNTAKTNVGTKVIQINYLEKLTHGRQSKVLWALQQLGLGFTI